MKNLILSLRHALCIALFSAHFGMLSASLCSQLYSQGNLQFNQVLTFEPGESYTVPAGKVLKIESVSMNGNVVTVPMTSTQNIGCSGPYGNYTLTVGIYAPVTYLMIGNISFFTPNIVGTCAWLLNPSPSTTTSTITSPVINCPLWLEAGKTVTIYSGSFQMIISAIEFNITP
jgi:hypothetical protein